MNHRITRLTGGSRIAAAKRTKARIKLPAISNVLNDGELY